MKRYIFHCGKSKIKTCPLNFNKSRVVLAWELSSTTLDASLNNHIIFWKSDIVNRLHNVVKVDQEQCASQLSSWSSGTDLGFGRQTSNPKRTPDDVANEDTWKYFPRTPNSFIKWFGDPKSGGRQWEDHYGNGALGRWMRQAKTVGSRPMNSNQASTTCQTLTWWLELVSGSDNGRYCSWSVVVGKYSNVYQIQWKKWRSDQLPTHQT